MTDLKEFKLKEFDALRAEILARSSEQMTVERQAAVGSAAIYSVILTLTGILNAPEGVPARAWDDPLLAVFWCIPPVLVAVSMLRWFANNTAIHSAAKYIRENLEPFFAIDCDQSREEYEKGWEQSEKYDNSNWKWIFRAWWAGLIVTVLAAVIVIFGRFVP